MLQFPCIMQTYKAGSYINTLPTWVLEAVYSPSQLTVTDYHGKQATCSATVAIWVKFLPLNAPLHFNAAHRSWRFCHCIVIPKFYSHLDYELRMLVLAQRGIHNKS